MPYKSNDTVSITALRQIGTIVHVRRRGRYLVAVGDVTMERREHELQPAVAKPAPRRVEPGVRTLEREAGLDRAKLLEVDLHGLRVHEAMKLVEQKLDRAVLADLDEVRVVHGIGSGAIMEALHDLLRTLSVVRAFKLDETNSGITRVFL